MSIWSDSNSGNDNKQQYPRL